jgi:hypothetical protein
MLRVPLRRGVALRAADFVGLKAHASTEGSKADSSTAPRGRENRGSQKRARLRSE